ncbi:hypothetical protein D3C71_1078880 [compost metagenome]
MTTVLLASALPVKTGRGSSVTSFSFSSPWMLPTSSTTDTMVGLAGGVASTVKSKAAEGTLTLPAASVAVTVTLCAPLPSGVVGVTLQSPAALAVVSPNRVAPS